MSSGWDQLQKQGFYFLATGSPQQNNPQQPNDTLYRPIPQQPLTQQPSPVAPIPNRGCGCGGR